MLNNLGDFLDFAGINYQEISGQYRIPIEGGSELFLKKNNNQIEFNFHEYGGDRNINISINYTDKTEDSLADFIQVLIEILNESEGQFFDFTSQSLHDYLESRLRHLFGQNIKIEIEGENPALAMELTEKPLSSEEIKEEIQKALDKNDKEAYYKYLKMLNDVKENNTFKYLKSFKKFFD